MRRYVCLLLVLYGLTFSFRSIGQLSDQINPELLTNLWDASWITHPEISGTEFGVYLFRKDFKLTGVDDEFIIHVSADNRYKLYVNGEYVANGPARGDEMNWRFENLDIARYLKEGENTIAAIVWNYADKRPLAQHSLYTGFILQGNTRMEQIINTDTTWRVFNDQAYSPLAVQVRGYYVVGPGEKFDGSKHPWDWKSKNANLSGWLNARELQAGTPIKSYRQYGSALGHVLVPRTIPLMEETTQRFATVRKTNIEVSKDFLKGAEGLNIPSNSSVSILIDQGQLTNAYPKTSFSGGNGSEIKLTYAEALFTPDNKKGDRDVIEGKEIQGTQDIILPDGGQDRTVQSLWWRTFRYVKLDVSTGPESLTIHDFYNTFTGYPFVEKAEFQSDDPRHEKIWEVGWRTQRLCAGETYFDCPYYEQLQYIGDARIQGLVTTYVTGDSLLLRNALSSAHDSRIPYGLTQSRYPSYYMQIIPTFSLVWITMIHDYWMHFEDDEYVRSMMPGALEVLGWFEKKIDSTGLMGLPEWWEFVDWVDYQGWDSGVPPGVYDSHSSIISLQYIYTIQKAVELFDAYGYKQQAVRYGELAERLKEKVYEKCYDSKRGLIADTPGKNLFSQHANVLAILTNTLPEEMQPLVMNKIRTEAGIAPCSYYFTFYLVKALEKAEMSNQYQEILQPWHEMLDLGLTTFAERQEPTRSDCHAWSASPLYYYLSLICGIKPSSPGFETVEIKPAFGDLKKIKGSMPHRYGMISVSMERDKKDKLKGEVLLPQKLNGTLEWNGSKIDLKPGTNTIDL